MTRAEALNAVRRRMPKLPGHPESNVSIPLAAAEVLLREPALGVTPLADIEVAEVLERGARKHARESLEDANGRSAMYHLAKAGKHLARFLLGQTCDPETGLHALAHVIARTSLALEMILRRRA